MMILIALREEKGEKKRDLLKKKRERLVILKHCLRAAVMNADYVLQPGKPLPADRNVHMSSHEK